MRKPKTAQFNIIKEMKLTRKQAAFVQYALEHPKESFTEAAAQSYNIKGTRHTAEVIASENLRKPEIMAILNNHDAAAQNTLAEGLKAEKNVYRFNSELKGYELVGVEKDHQSRLKAADSILDRIHGKATQRIESHSTGVTLSVDLTQALQDKT